MADLFPPSTPPNPTTPPVDPLITPSSPMDEELEEDELDEAENLSPFKVLGKSAPPAGTVPMAVPPVAPLPSQTIPVTPPVENMSPSPVTPLVPPVSAPMPSAAPSPIPPTPPTWTPAPLVTPVAPPVVPTPAPPMAPVSPVVVPVPPTTPFSTPPTPPAPLRTPSVPVTAEVPPRPVTAAPASGSPMDEPLDTAALVAEAKTVASPLVLPNRTLGLRAGSGLEDKADLLIQQEDIAREGAAQQGAVPIKTNPPKVPVPPTPGTVKVPPPLPITPAPTQPPVRPIAPPVLAKPVTSEPMRMATPPLLPVETVHHATSPALIAAGILLGIGVLVGGLFVLALTGARVPVLGKMVSGLEGSAPQAMARASAYVDALGSYRYSGSVNLTLQNQQASSSGAQALSSLETKTAEALVTDAGTSFLESNTVNANAKADVPVLLSGTLGKSWFGTFPVNTDKGMITTDGSKVAATLLAPALQPLPLQAILKAIKTEQAYAKVSNGGQPAALYTVSLSPETLSAYFPTGATLETPTAKVVLAWKGQSQVAGQPISAEITGQFTFNELIYKYVISQAYAGWGDKVPVSTDLVAQGSANTASAITLPLQSFVARLGISYEALTASGSATAATPTPSASPSEEPTATPTATPSTAITPSGQTVSEVQVDRALDPTPPTPPASTQAKARDRQRKQDLTDIKKALDAYKVATGSYPSVSGEVQLASNTTLFSALVSSYLTAMPVDPLNSTYYYVYNVSASGYVLRAILEDTTDSSAVAGRVYTYYQVTN